MSKFSRADDYFQTTWVTPSTSVRVDWFASKHAHQLLYHFRSSLELGQRKAAKSRNKNGNPIELSSKILAIIADPFKNDSVYVAESSGTLRAVALEVGEPLLLLFVYWDPMWTAAVKRHWLIGYI